MSEPANYRQAVGRGVRKALRIAAIVAIALLFQHLLDAGLALVANAATRPDGVTVFIAAGMLMGIAIGYLTGRQSAQQRNEPNQHQAAGDGSTQMQVGGGR
jgi:hypothetical protein